MTRLWYLAGGLAVAAVLGLVRSPSSADDKKPSVKEIMTKAHKGGTSHLSIIAQELKEDEPNWADVQTNTKELVRLGTQLGKATPPQGEKDSWDKLTKAYLKDAKALSAAAGKKDKAKAKDAFKQLGTNCKNCHKVHKPK